MTIKLVSRDTEGELLLEGRLDSTSSVETGEIFQQMSERFDRVVLNMAKLEYVSSAGLRVLLAAQKVMNRQGSMKISHVNTDIMEAFEITGFCDILTIQ